MAGRGAAPAVAPYGSWVSPIGLGLVATGRAWASYPRLEGDDAWWEEARPAEDGRQAVVRRRPDGTTADAVPSEVNVRTMVHEYGGAAWTVSAGVLYYSDAADGRLYRVRPGELPEALTVPGALRYADLVVDGPRERLVCVGEDHRRDGVEAVNRVVTVELGALAPIAPQPLVEGADFYAAPRLSPDGRRLAWLSWTHPDMPWDGTTLWVGELDAAGQVHDAQPVAGGPGRWIAQPRWSPTGVLYCLAEPTGWMNLYRLAGGSLEPVLALAADLARPDWTLGQATYACLDDGGLLAIARADGRDRLWRVDAAGTATPLSLPFDEIDAVVAAGDRVLLTADGSNDPGGVVELDLSTSAWTLIRPSLALDLDPEALSSPQSITFPTSDGAVAHALFYPPRNAVFAAPPGERPPLIVTSHGGPTAAAGAGLRLSTQFFTSRGVAVVDVDYRGSSGYGTAYRRALEGQWGVYDMDDCVAAAASLVAEGLVDGARLAIRGGSASGYTTLCALTFGDAFAAGVSYFGIGDLETFARDTHKFESHYLERLVGPYPADLARYVARSPIHALDRLSCPLLILQGLDDHVVPPSQAQEMVAALRARGLPYGYLAFAGEGHGFRRAATVERATAAELAFYGEVFGFTPAGDVPLFHLERPPFDGG